MNSLQKEFKDITHALEGLQPGDKFAEAMAGFINKAKDEIETMEQNYKIMMVRRVRYESACLIRE